MPSSCANRFQWQDVATARIRVGGGWLIAPQAEAFSTLTNLTTDLASCEPWSKLLKESIQGLYSVLVKGLLDCMYSVLPMAHVRAVAFDAGSWFGRAWPQ